MFAYTCYSDRTQNTLTSQCASVAGRSTRRTHYVRSRLTSSRRVPRNCTRLLLQFRRPRVRTAARQKTESFLQHTRITSCTHTSSHRNLRARLANIDKKMQIVISRFHNIDQKKCKLLFRGFITLTKKMQIVISRFHNVLL